MTKNQRKQAEAAFSTIKILAMTGKDVWPWMVELKGHTRESTSRGFYLATSRKVVERYHRTGRGGAKIYRSLLYLAEEAQQQ